MVDASYQCDQMRQGCPLSPIVFNLNLDVVLRMIQGTGEWVTIEQNRVYQLAYADDIALLANSPAGLRHMLFAAEQGARAVGLTFNPAKCASLHIADRGEDAVRPTEFSIENTPITAIAAGEALMKRLIISDGVRWSRDIYVEHVLGERQYSVP